MSAERALVTFSPALRRARMIAKKGARVLKMDRYGGRRKFADADMPALARIVAAAPSLVKLVLQGHTAVTAAGWATFLDGIAAGGNLTHINLEGARCRRAVLYHTFCLCLVQCVL